MPFDDLRSSYVQKTFKKREMRFFFPFDKKIAKDFVDVLLKHLLTLNK